ncbi:Subtilisin inhibitor-like [Actinopolyspora xinjiangensis]|uniref:Subtilisin inhibitor-like n=1 Tax=Actinopolyspora xinjiangensis TaxID=405564 RepID=A0A1H0UUN5_9ACTN|nr:SSI family serine proteinase inhibitor [Actinopolyspora xinjiangensis]SDP69853.1 Subtilisin inhibitor-like [Actinopolyspora xinjiangensis]
MSFSGALGRTLLTATAVAAVSLVPAVSHGGVEEASAAAPTTADGTDRGVSVLSLRVVPGDRAERARSAILRCGPAGGTHPKAEAACERLVKAGGEFGALRADRDPMCPLVYRPVTVHATGTWRNQPVEHRETFSNECEMSAHTGKIFNF